MDNEMIVDFINNVEPDFSYGTSDGMSRAMVESAENIARINDYITESVYEVYTEADDSDKPGFLGKIANKIGIYFTLFMNIIKKFITKIKGFFMTIKRKITMGFTKAVKSLGNFLNNRIKNNKKKFDATTVEIYKWNADVLDKIQFIKYYGETKTFEKYDDVVTYYDDIKEKINDISSTDNDGGKKNLLTKYEINFIPNTAVDFLKKQYKVNIDSKINEVYNSLMKETNNTIKSLKTQEKEVKKEYLKSSGSDENTRQDLKETVKALNYSINQWTLLKYRVTQKIASACFKYYKKLLSAVKKVIGGFNISGNSSDYDNREENEIKAYTNSAPLVL